MSGNGNQYQLSTQNSTSGAPERIVDKRTGDVKIYERKNGGQIVTITETHQQKQYYPPSK
ncbi:hypothetical protein CRE_24814 [Caenorhabditis remanei]|uniref:Uncharacterized protein n=1 Tax=Caenorhabditis remanei TaxID=31234 RepID=E3NHN3_CAERE|nr:hypothetical protein CRE_24814 [Caenorhabditis remanei]